MEKENQETTLLLFTENELFSADYLSRIKDLRGCADGDSRNTVNNVSTGEEQVSVRKRVSACILILHLYLEVNHQACHRSEPSK